MKTTRLLTVGRDPVTPYSTAAPPTGSASDQTSTSHASTAGSNNSTASSEPYEEPNQLLAYLAQPPTEEGSVYGRLGGCIAVVHTSYANTESAS